MASKYNCEDPKTWPIIKFSKRYKKLTGKTQAVLKLATRVLLEYQSPWFLNYDTEAEDGSHYALPSKGEYILLLFEESYGSIFTTIRRYTPQKYDYYRDQVGKFFTIRIDEPPTYCAGCSFKCQASDCDCTCHDKIRKYWGR